MEGFYCQQCGWQRAWSRGSISWRFYERMIQVVSPLWNESQVGLRGSARNSSGPERHLTSKRQIPRFYAVNVEGATFKERFVKINTSVGKPSRPWGPRARSSEVSFGAEG